MFVPRTTTATRGRRRQAREEARASILAAADELLRERPFRELTIDELMKRAGLSRTIFYRHFDDLGQLVMQLLWAAGAPLRESNDRTYEAAAELPVLRQGLDTLVDWFAENGPLLAAVADAATYDEEIERIYEEILQRWYDRFRTTMAEAAAAGRIVPIADGEAEALVSLNERYLLRKLGRVPQADPEEVRATLWSVWSRYLFGPDGPK